MKLDPEESVISDDLSLAVMGRGKWVSFRETVKGDGGYNWVTTGFRWEPDEPDLKNNQVLSDGGR